MVEGKIKEFRVSATVYSSRLVGGASHGIAGIGHRYIPRSKSDDMTPPVASGHGSYFSLVRKIKRAVYILFEFL